MIDELGVIEIVGMKYYADGERRVSYAYGNHTPLYLIREPDNLYDEYAVGVYDNGHLIGHVSRNDSYAVYDRLEEASWRMGHDVAFEAYVCRGGSHVQINDVRGIE